MDKLSVIKIGGALIEDKEALTVFLSDVAVHQGLKIIVHGGGKKATQWASKMNLPVKMHQGRRITDEDTLSLITAVYGGLVNKSITASLQALGINSIGISGADGNAIQASKRPIEPIDFGFVGDVTQVNPLFFDQLLQLNQLPVCCAITHDGKGQLLNTNADTIAAEIAKAMSNKYDVRLYYCFELNGVLEDINQPESIIETITTDSYKQLLSDGVIADGMLPKLHNAFDALENGVTEIGIGSTKMIQKDCKYTSIRK